MRFGKEEKDAIRQIVANEIKDVLRQEFTDLKAQIGTDGHRRTVKPKQVGRQIHLGYERGAPGVPMPTGSADGQRTMMGTGGGQPAAPYHGNRQSHEDMPMIGPTVDAAPRARRSATRRRRGPSRDVEEMAHALAKTHFELSQELRTNLHVLREVILQSQQIARRIMAILGKGEGPS